MRAKVERTINSLYPASEYHCEMNAHTLILALIFSQCTGSHLKAQTTQLRFGDKTVKLLRIGNKDSTMLTRWLHVHDNERTAVEAFSALADSGMRNELISWRHTGKRMVDFKHSDKRYVFDPNRIFTTKGIETTLKKEGSYSAGAFNVVQREAEKYKKQFVNGNDIIIVLHNNTDSGGLHLCWPCIKYLEPHSLLR